jgi:hypothetical protein
MSISSTVVHRADIQFHEAPQALRSFVGCFWVVTAERGATIRVVPDGSTAISIQLQRRGPSGWVLRGPLVRPDERRFRSPVIMIGVRLRPGVAFLLSGIAARAMLGRLSIGALATLATGVVTARIAPSRLVRLIPGVLLLIAFIPVHMMLWEKFPVWYHLTFLLSLVPLSYVGGAIAGGHRAILRTEPFHE